MEKNTLRQMVWESADDPQGRRWSRGSLDLLLSMVLDEEWQGILARQPFYTYAQETLETAAGGYVDLNGLQERLHRLRLVERDGRELKEAQLRQVSIRDGAPTGPHGTWALLGQRLYPFPLEAGEEVEIHYSYRPQSFHALEESEEVTFPAGFEAVPIYEATARALQKGGAEDPSFYLHKAEELRAKLYAQLSRPGPGGIRLETSSPPEEFGGV